MSETTKTLSEKDYAQVIQKSANNDGTLGVNGFLAGKIGHKFTRTTVSSTIEDFRFLDVVSTKTGTTSITSPIITGLPSTLDLKIGQYVYGIGIPANAKILTIDSSTQVTLDQNATASGSISLKFANLLQNLRITYDNSTHDNVDDAERIE